MKEYGPHFNEPLPLPPELNWNLKTDRRSAKLPDRRLFLIFLASRSQAGRLFSLHPLPGKTGS